MLLPTTRGPYRRRQPGPTDPPASSMRDDDKMRAERSVLRTPVSTTGSSPTFRTISRVSPRNDRRYATRSGLSTSISSSEPDRNAGVSYRRVGMREPRDAEPEAVSRERLTSVVLRPRRGSADDVVRTGLRPCSRLRNGKDRVARHAEGSNDDRVVGRPARVVCQAILAVEGPRPRPADNAVRCRRGGEQLENRCRQRGVLDKAWSMGVRGRVRGLGDALGHAVDPDFDALAPRRYPPHGLCDLG